MRYTLQELRNSEKFNEFKEEINKKDEFRKFQNLYNAKDFEEKFDREDKCREINRVDRLEDEEIFIIKKGNATVESYAEVEIGYCHYVRLYGEEYLEDYDEEDRKYSMSSFLAMEVEIV